jgi:hypothetical protein
MRNGPQRHSSSDFLPLLTKLPSSRQTGSNPFHPSRGLLATNLTVFPRRLQLPIPLDDFRFRRVVLPSFLHGFAPLS